MTQLYSQRVLFLFGRQLSFMERKHALLNNINLKETNITSIQIHQQELESWPHLAAAGAEKEGPLMNKFFLAELDWEGENRFCWRDSQPCLIYVNIIHIVLMRKLRYRIGKILLKITLIISGIFGIFTENALPFNFSSQLSF